MSDASVKRPSNPCPWRHGRRTAPRRRQAEEPQGAGWRRSSKHRVAEAHGRAAGDVIVLVFCGTLAQLDHGIWAVVNSYFRSFFVLIPVLIFFPRTYHISPSIVFPFPGGWAIGSLLLVNLVAAHATRFKISLKRTGIFLIHIGLIVLMMGELVTGIFAIEGNMSIATGQSTNYVDKTRTWNWPW